MHTSSNNSLTRLHQAPADHSPRPPRLVPFQTLLSSCVQRPQPLMPDAMIQPPNTAAGDFTCIHARGVLVPFASVRPANLISCAYLLLSLIFFFAFPIYCSISRRDEKKATQAANKQQQHSNKQQAASTVHSGPRSIPSLPPHPTNNRPVLWPHPA